jgi:hypothetical protein
MLNLDKSEDFFNIEHNENPKSIFKSSIYDSRKNKNKLLNNKQGNTKLDEASSYHEEANEDDDDDEFKAETWHTISLQNFKQKLISMLNTNHQPTITSLSTKYPSKNNAALTKTSTSSVVKNSKINKLISKSKTPYDKEANFLYYNQTRFPSHSSKLPMPSLETIKSNQSQASSQKLKILSLSSPAMLFLSTTTSKALKYSSSSPTSSLIHNHRSNYKNNEMYSILVSIFTAALFLIFIMWRWFKMKSDLRKALREQLEIQQMDGGGGGGGGSRFGGGGRGRVVRNSSFSSRRNTPSSSSSSSSTCNGGYRWSSHYHHYRHHNHHFYHHNRLLNSAKRQQLQATAASIIAQLANGEHRSPEEHRQMISTAKCCLEQLKAHARLISHNRFNTRESDNLNNYYNFYSRYDGQPPLNYNNRNFNNTVELSCSRNNIPLLHNSPLDPTDNQTTILESLSSNSSVADYTTLGYQQCATINEKPPSYESIIKSSSLPSYYHFATEEKQPSKN